MPGLSAVIDQNAHQGVGVVPSEQPRVPVEKQLLVVVDLDGESIPRVACAGVERDVLRLQLDERFAGQWFAWPPAALPVVLSAVSDPVERESRDERRVRWVEQFLERIGVRIALVFALRSVETHAFGGREPRDAPEPQRLRGEHAGRAVVPAPECC